MKSSTRQRLAGSVDSLLLLDVEGAVDKQHRQATIDLKSDELSVLCSTNDQLEAEISSPSSFI